MALKPCPHCGHPISEKAEKCPECGQDPHLTPEELAEQQQQREKKRKTALIVSTSAFVVILAVLCVIFIPRYIEYTRKLEAYNEAQELFDMEEYTDSVLAFEKLGDFKDSAQKALDARYQYAYKNQDKNDPMTIAYIEYLSDKNYPYIRALSDAVYKWRGTAYAAKSKGGDPVTTAFGPDDPLYFVLNVSGGKPGEQITVQYTVDFFSSVNAAKAWDCAKTESHSFSHKIGDGESCYVYWEDGIGTTEYKFIRIRFFTPSCPSVFASAEARISR